MFFEKEQLVKKVIGVLWLSLIATIASAASPGAHTTDAAHLYGAHITYTRK